MIQRLEPSEARETVGVWLAMDDNKVKQAKVHKGKTLAFAAQMKGAKLSQFECRDAVVSTIL